jgi:hypothetical protein
MQTTRKRGVFFKQGRVFEDRCGITQGLSSGRRLNFGIHKAVWLP